MSLVRPYNKLAVPNVVEQKYIDAWAIIETEVERLLNLGWKADTKGKEAEALKNYKAANHYIYLFHYAMNIDSYMERNNIKRDCISEEVFCRFKIQCVQDNLPCLSSDFEASYLKKWEELAEALNIELKKECEEELIGEWEYCSFKTKSFSIVTGEPDFDCEPRTASCSTLKQIIP